MKLPREKAVFLMVFASNVRDSYPILAKPLDHLDKPETLREHLDHAIHDTLIDLGWDEPTDDLDYLAILHEWIEDARPDIGEAIELTTDQVEE